MTKNNLIIYHSDSDGRLSAAICRKWVHSQTKKGEHHGVCTLCEVNYNTYTAKLHQEHLTQFYDNIFIVDFSLETEEMMLELKDRCTNFYWCDHHASSKKTLAFLWEDTKVLGERGIGKSGCLLTWNTLFPYKEVPYVVDLVNDYDLWLFKLGPETEALHESMNDEASLNVWERLVYNDSPTLKKVKEHISEGYLLLDKKDQRIQKRLKQGIIRDFAEYKAVIINSTTDISKLGNVACETNEVDLAIIYSFFREGNTPKVSLSLRSIGDKCDVGKLAEKYKGGGHMNASGASIDLEQFIEILQNRSGK